jgi:hypothetical protein
MLYLEKINGELIDEIKTLIFAQNSGTTKK